MNFTPTFLEVSKTNLIKHGMINPTEEPETGYLNCDGSPSKTTILNMKQSGQNNKYSQQSFGKRESNLIDNPTYSKQKERLKNKLL